MGLTALQPDPFRALAEPARRELLELLVGGPSPVGSLVERTGLRQPTVSKHLGALREAGLVSVSRRGRERIYSVEGAGLKAVHDWAASFEPFWRHQLGRIKARAEKATGAVAANKEKQR